MTSLSICMCGAQAGYPHRSTCPYPYYGHSKTEYARWNTERDQLEHRRLIADAAEAQATIDEDELEEHSQRVGDLLDVPNAPTDSTFGPLWLCDDCQSARVAMPCYVDQNYDVLDWSVCCDTKSYCHTCDAETTTDAFLIHSNPAKGLTRV